MHTKTLYFSFILLVVLYFSNQTREGFRVQIPHVRHFKNIKIPKGFTNILNTVTFGRVGEKKSQKGEEGGSCFSQDREGGPCNEGLKCNENGKCEKK